MAHALVREHSGMAACLALALLSLSNDTLNTCLFPALALTFPAAREISTFVGALFSLAVAVLAYKRPSFLRENLASAVALALLAASALSLYLGITWGSRSILAIGGPIGGISSFWFSVLIGATLAKSGPQQALPAIAGAFAIEYTVRATSATLGVQLSMQTASFLYFTSMAGAYVLIRPAAHALLEETRTKAAPMVLHVTNPSSFLPFSNRVFVSIFLFNLACGYAFTSQTAQLSTAASLVSFIPVLGIFCLVTLKKNVSLDGLYQVSTLLVFAGFLTSLLPLIGAMDPMSIQAHTVFMQGGSGCFNVLMYYLVASVGHRNLLGAFSTSAFAVAASWLGIGIGAPLAQMVGSISEHDPVLSAWGAMGIAFGFMAYNFVAMKNFSFKETILGIVPALEPQDSAEHNEAFQDPLANFDEACHRVAEHYRLTNRETDVLKLLARGRTGMVIQEKLVLSHNTVKTHVRHVYTKMEIHSQQELIDLVETERSSLLDSGI